MAFHPAEPNEIGARSSDTANNLNFTDALGNSGSKFEQPIFKSSQDRSKDRSKQSNGIGLPPLSDLGGGIPSGYTSFLEAPPLALENRQGRATLPSATSFLETKPASERTLLPEPLSQGDGVAGAIKASLETLPKLEALQSAESEPEAVPRSKDIYEDSSERSPIAQLLKMRTPGESQAVPRALFDTSKAGVRDNSSGAVNESARINNVGIGDSEGLPRYREQILGRLPELARLERDESGEQGFDNLNGSPEGYLFAQKLELAKQFGKPDTKYSRLVDGKGTREIQTATDFSTLETSYGDDGTCETGHYDNFRRPLLKVSEQYNSGDVEFKMVQFDYGKGEKVSPFPSRTREITYKNGQATVDVFDHSGVNVKLLSSDAWSA